MVLYRQQVDSSGNQLGRALGTILYTNISGDFSRDIRADISANMSAAQASGTSFCVAQWSVALINTGSLSGIQGFEGLPPRYKLGSISFASIDVTDEFHFWNYTKQGFPIQSCIVTPSTYAGVPIDAGSIPSPASRNNLDPVLSASNNGNIVLARQVYRTSQFLFGNTTFNVAPNLASQVYTCAVNFIGQWGNVPAAPVTNYLTNI